MEVGLNMRLDLVSKEAMHNMKKNFNSLFSEHPLPEFTESLGWKNPRSYFLHWHSNNYFEEVLKSLFASFSKNADIEGAYVLVANDEDWYEIWVYTPELTKTLYRWQDKEVSSFMCPTDEEYENDDFADEKFDSDEAMMKLIDTVREKYMPTDKSIDQ